MIWFLKVLSPKLISKVKACLRTNTTVCGRASVEVMLADDGSKATKTVTTTVGGSGVEFEQVEYN